MPYISFVIPVFNEEENLHELIDRLSRAADTFGRPWEAVFVNDGSRDRSLEILRESALRDPRIVVVDFNRNYGQHAAVFAGFEEAAGEIIITLDADLQNPPEEFPKLVARMEEGYDVVGSVRIQRKDTLFRRLASRIVNKGTSLATGVQLSDYGCMLRAYRRGVVRTLAESKEISTFIPVLADMFAGRVSEVRVAHAERTRGESKYGIWKLIKLQFDLLTSFTLWPLRFTIVVGILTSAASILLALTLVAGRVLYGDQWAVSGVFTVLAGVFFFIGVQLFAVGLLGEYVGRIYMQVRRRPRYVVRERIRGGNSTPRPTS